MMKGGAQPRPLELLWVGRRGGGQVWVAGAGARVLMRKPLGLSLLQGVSMPGPYTDSVLKVPRRYASVQSPLAHPRMHSPWE